MGKKLIYLLCFLFLVSFVNAQPSTTIYSFPQGYTIVPIEYEQLKAGEDFNYFFYLYNTSTGLKIDNSSVNCTFHLSDSQGTLLLEDVEVYQPNGYWYTPVNGSYVSEQGYYYYGVDCSDGLGGAISGVFAVTYSGKDLTTAQSVLYIGFLSLMVLIFFLNFVGMGYLPSKNERDEEGKLMSISYLKYFRNVLWMTGYFLFIAITFLASNIAFAYLGEEMFAQMLFTIYQISFGLAPVVIIVWLIWIFASMFHDRRFQQLLNRGMMPGGNTL